MSDEEETVKGKGYNVEGVSVKRPGEKEFAPMVVKLGTVTANGWVDGRFELLNKSEHIVRVYGGHMKAVDVSPGQSINAEMSGPLHSYAILEE